MHHLEYCEQKNPQLIDRLLPSKWDLLELDPPVGFRRKHHKAEPRRVHTRERQHAQDSHAQLLASQQEARSWMQADQQASAAESQARLKIEQVGARLSGVKDAKAKWKRFATHTLHRSESVHDVKRVARAAVHWPPKPVHRNNAKYLSSEVDTNQAAEALMEAPRRPSRRAGYARTLTAHDVVVAPLLVRIPIERRQVQVRHEARVTKLQRLAELSTGGDDDGGEEDKSEKTVAVVAPRHAVKRVVSVTTTTTTASPSSSAAAPATAVSIPTATPTTVVPEPASRQHRPRAGPSAAAHLPSPVRTSNPFEVLSSLLDTDLTSEVGSRRRRSHTQRNQPSPKQHSAAA